MKHIVKTLLAVAASFLITAAAWPQASAPSSAERVPVLVELFTSEGCSSCPPADRFVQLLDTQPVPGLQIIVLSEHVDYWNHQGWKDPFSSPDFSERQQVYGAEFRLPEVYTPQLVIDGSRQMSGSDVKQAQAALQEASKNPKIPLQITNLAAGRGRLTFHVQGALPNPAKDLRAVELYAVAALNRAQNHVTAGENARRDLTHAAVVHKIMRIAKLKPGDSVSRDVELKIDGKVDPSNLRAVVFLQDSKSKRVIGAAMKIAESAASDSASLSIRPK